MKYPKKLNIITNNNIFLYPYMISPVILSDENNIKNALKALKNNLPAIIAPANDNKVYKCGVIGSIIRKVDMPNGNIKILFQGYAKGKILSINKYSASVDIIAMQEIDENTKEALIGLIKEKILKLASLSTYFSEEIIESINDTKDIIKLIDMVLNSLNINIDLAYEFFVDNDIKNKGYKLIELLDNKIKASNIKEEIKNKTNNKLNQVQKEYYLKEQLRQIQKELGTDTQKEEEINNYTKKLDNIRPYIYNDAYIEINKQISKFKKLHPDSSEANTIQNYIETALELPFDKKININIDLKVLKNRLDKDHFALVEPKNRIIEYFALNKLLKKRKIKNQNKAILCFYGPPGVGKTSLANSIAKALKRPLIRIALGGLEDVNELRGHRRTYVGAMPGRIVQGLIEAKYINPVVVLDEIDKISRHYKGDPSAVLLEILDPEQNTHFRDYYLNFDINLSDIIFIATANDIGAIMPALKDRMEMIELSSYTPIEKFNIAKYHLVPDERAKHGIKKDEIIINDEIIKIIIDNYTREAGVRRLRQKIASIYRKNAYKILGNEKININEDNLKDFLGKKIFEDDKNDKIDKVGLVNGLAYTAYGGEVLKIEAIKLNSSKDIDLVLTGSLGEVMKESAKIAFNVIKSIKKDFDNSDKYTLHLHVPDGATPKDGPSAGLAIASVIASVMWDQKIKCDFAMTGEIDLLGRALAIGGLKEKLIAAYKQGIKNIIIPKANQKDLTDLPSEVLDELNINIVENIKEVLDLVLVKS